MRRPRSRPFPPQWWTALPWSRPTAMRRGGSSANRWPATSLRSVVEPGTAVRITTGAPIPPGADVVVKVEQADEVDGWVTPHPGQGLRPGLGIRPIGSDVQAGEQVLAAGQALGPAELGMLASLGMAAAPVHRRPVVGVFSTGDELVDPGQPLAPGQIYDSNRPTLLAAVAQAGGQPLDLGIIRDRPGELEQQLAAGLAEADVLVTSGGVSMGELDLLKPLLERWGIVHFGRVLMKPGKPLTFATLPARDAPTVTIDPTQPARPVFALPGNPVSSLVTFQLVRASGHPPLLGHRAGRPAADHRRAGPRLSPRPGAAGVSPRDPAPRGRALRRRLHRQPGLQPSAVSQRRQWAAGAGAGDGVLPAGAERPVLLLDDEWLATGIDTRIAVPRFLRVPMSSSEFP